MKTGKRAKRRQRAQESMETGIPLSDTLHMYLIGVHQAGKHSPGQDVGGPNRDGKGIQDTTGDNTLMVHLHRPVDLGR